MKLGCSSQSFDRALQEKQLELLAWVSYAAESLRLDAIEVEDKHFPSTAPDFLGTLREQIAGRGLALSSVTIGNNFGLPTAAERAGQVAYVRRWLGIARELGAPVVRIFAGWPRSADGALWQKMIECLRESCVYAEQAGVLLGLENHNHGGFVRVAEDALRIFGEVSSPWLRLNLDTGNYLDGLRSIEKTAAWAVHVHAKLREVAPDGCERTLDYPEIVALLRRVDYGGVISLEYEGLDDPFTVLPRAVSYFRHLLAQP